MTGISDGEDDIATGLNDYDADFIIVAHEAMPDILAELRRLQKELKDARYTIIELSEALDE